MAGTAHHDREHRDDDQPADHSEGLAAATVQFDDREDRADQMHAQIDAWIAELADGADEARASEQFQRWLDVQSRFHDYSVNNQLLILRQMPDATKVAGYHTWQELGRQVQSGESAIWIWAPIITEKCPECGNSESHHERDGHQCDHHQDSDPEEWDRGVVGFRPTSVFDISQTEGEPLPALETAAHGDGDELLTALREAVDDLDVHLEVIAPSNWEHGEARGVCPRHSPVDCQPVIEVRDRENRADLARTTIHEIAHAQLHMDVADGDEQAKRELEAEAVAYTVGRHFGLDTSNSAFYLASWSDEPADALRDRLDRISATAQELIDTIETHHPSIDPMQ